MLTAPVADGLSKEKFLELLNKDKAAKAKQSSEAPEEEDEKKPKWGVLSDNYMLDASFKKWKDTAESDNDDDDDEGEQEREFESDDMEEEEEELEMESD